MLPALKESVDPLSVSLTDTEISAFLTAAGHRPDTEEFAAVTGLVRSLCDLPGAWHNRDPDYCLRNLAAHLKSTQDLQTRLEGELDFYQTLVSHGQDDAFFILLETGYTFTSRLAGDITLPCFLFTDLAGVPYGAFNLFADREFARLTYLQGLSRTSSKHQKIVFGVSWVEACIDRILEAYKPLHKLGLEFWIDVDPRMPAENVTFMKKVRDWYAQRTPINSQGFTHRLSPAKARVKQVLG